MKYLIIILAMGLSVDAKACSDLQAAFSGVNSILETRLQTAILVLQAHQQQRQPCESGFCAVTREEQVAVVEEKVVRDLQQQVQQLFQQIQQRSQQQQQQAQYQYHQQRGQQQQPQSGQ